jgi:hypothetical protein
MNTKEKFEGGFEKSEVTLVPIAFITCIDEPQCQVPGKLVNGWRTPGHRILLICKLR